MHWYNVSYMNTIVLICDKNSCSIISSSIPLRGCIKGNNWTAKVAEQQAHQLASYGD